MEDNISKKREAIRQLEETESPDSTIEIKPGVFITRVRKGEEIILPDNITVKIIAVEYHKGEEYRPKSIVIRITAPSKYPVIRPEYRAIDLEKWSNLSRHSEEKTSVTLRRFFYGEKEKDVVEIGKYKIVVFPFFTKPKELYSQGYLCTLKIIYPGEIFAEK